jgi:hypothetical protein
MIAQNRKVFRTSQEEMYMHSFVFDSLSGSENVINDLFADLYTEIIGIAPESMSYTHDKGSIVLPLSNEEFLRRRRTSIEDIDLSNDTKFMLVRVGEYNGYAENKNTSSEELDTYYLFDYISGQVIEKFQHATNVQFYNDTLLLVSLSNKFFVYSINNKSEVFTMKGEHEYSFHALTDDFVLCNVFKKNEPPYPHINESHIISLSDRKIVHSFENLPSHCIPFLGVSFNGEYMAYSIEGKKMWEWDTFVFNFRSKEISVVKKKSKFLNWAKYSNEMVLFNTNDKTISIHDCQGGSQLSKIEFDSEYLDQVPHVINVDFVKGDSVLILSGEDNTSGPRNIRVVDRYTNKLLKEIEGHTISVSHGNKDFFIVNNPYYPALYDFEGFNEVLKMQSRGDKLMFDDSGENLYMISERNPQVGEYYQPFQLINLETNKVVFSSENFSYTHCFDNKNGLFLNAGHPHHLASGNIIDFVDMNQVGDGDYAANVNNHVIGSLLCNTEGYLFFDKFSRYDCSPEFFDRIYFSCPTSNDHQQGVFPKAFKYESLFVKGLWYSTITLRSNGTLNAPRLPQSGNWYNGRFWSDGAYTEPTCETVSIATVSYMDKQNNTVNLRNYSGKPVQILKSEILFQCDIWNEEHTKLMFTYFADRFGGYIAMTPEGYFTKSNEFYGKIGLSINDTLYELSQIESSFYRTDVIRGLLSSKDYKPKLKNVNALKSPPNVEFEIIDDTKNRGVILEDSNLSDSAVKVRISAVNTGGGIKELRLFNNRKLVADTIFRNIEFNAKVEFICYITLMQGRNQLEAIGVANDNTLSKPESITRYVKEQKDALKPDLHILGIGINDYKKSSYDLSFCVRDMRSFVDTLKMTSSAIFDSIYTYTLVNDLATKANFRTSLDSVASIAKPEDVFILFYAGHGIAHDSGIDNSFYFVTHDVMQMEDPANCEEYGFSGIELKDGLKRICANKQLFIIDACNSGAFAEQRLRGGQTEENAIASLNRSSGAAVFASTTSSQNASEIDEIGHGVFTYVLLKAICGGASDENCEITISGLENYIYKEVPRVTEKYRGSKQYPTFSKFGQNYPIGMKCKD